MYIFSGELSPEARLRLKNEERFFNFRIHKRLLLQSFLGHDFTNLFAKLFRLIILQNIKDRQSENLQNVMKANLSSVQC